MTITQTVEIPADRRITLEIPREVPTGATVRVESNIIPFVKKVDYIITRNTKDFSDNSIPAVTPEQFIEIITDI